MNGVLVGLRRGQVVVRAGAVFVDVVDGLWGCRRGLMAWSWTLRCGAGCNHGVPAGLLRGTDATLGNEHNIVQAMVVCGSPTPDDAPGCLTFAMWSNALERLVPRPAHGLERIAAASKTPAMPPSASPFASPLRCGQTRAGTSRAATRARSGTRRAGCRAPPWRPRTPWPGGWAERSSGGGGWYFPGARNTCSADAALLRAVSAQERGAAPRPRS